LPRLILWTSSASSARLLNILLEGTPAAFHLSEIAPAWGRSEGVVNVHDLHVWSLGSNSSALACHVTSPTFRPSESACILARLKYVLKERFHISHATIQFEHMGCEQLDGCVVPMEELASRQSRGHHKPRA